MDIYRITIEAIGPYALDFLGTWADPTGRIRSAYRLQGISFGTDFVLDRRLAFQEINELLACYVRKKRLTLKETAQLCAAEEVRWKLESLQDTAAV